MKGFRGVVSLIFVLTVALGASVDNSLQLEKDEIILAVNNAKTTWKAGRNFHPSLDKSYLKHLLGVKDDGQGPKLPVLKDDGENLSVPKSFDAREQWSQCASLGTIRDQGPCGSCWAVAAASAFADRACIASQGSFNALLSAEQLLTCCLDCGDGCNGGYPSAAWTHIQTTGIVTGGLFHSHEGCQPYLLPSCEHHMSGKEKNCSLYHLDTPKCRPGCYNKKYKDHTFAEDHHKVKSTFSIENNEKQMQKEIMKYGPVEAAYVVYEDFFSYKSGVYQHVSGSMVGRHAVKVLGWGVENGTPYWLVANSWNAEWGDQGFFKIKRGTNECGFESSITGGYVS